MSTTKNSRADEQTERLMYTETVGKQSGRRTDRETNVDGNSRADEQTQRLTYTEAVEQTNRQRETNVHGNGRADEQRERD